MVLTIFVAFMKKIVCVFFFLVYKTKKMLYFGLWIIDFAIVSFVGDSKGSSEF